MSGEAIALVGFCAVVTAAIKGIGPVVFGGRPLPAWLASIVGLLAPALLAALVVTQALADDDRLAIGPETAGVTVAGIAAWRRANVVACIALAAGVTAVLRFATS